MGKRSNTFGRDYDWANHSTPKSGTVTEVGEHLVLSGSPDDYQDIGSRLVSPRPAPGYSIKPSCSMPNCVVHVDYIAPLVPAYPAGVCVYCGWPAGTKDHILPVSWTGLAVRSRTVTVPACAECNSAIGDTYAPTVEERREVAHRYLRRRYARYLRAIMWGESDLDAMGHTMRTAAVRHMNRHEAIMQRLAWPIDPLYDTRALVDIVGV